MIAEIENKIKSRIRYLKGSDKSISKEYERIVKTNLVELQAILNYIEELKRDYMH